MQHLPIGILHRNWSINIVESERTSLYWSLQKAVSLSLCPNMYIASTDWLQGREGGREGEGMNGTNTTAGLFQHDMSDKEQRSIKCDKVEGVPWPAMCRPVRYSTGLLSPLSPHKHT